MINVTITGTNAVQAALQGQIKQVKFAAAKALTQTATAIKDAAPAALETALDKPTPFTKRGFYIKPAKRDNLIAEVGFRDIQAKYMQLQIAGGSRDPGPKGLKLASNVTPNQFGNIPKGLIAQLVRVAKKEQTLSKVKARRINLGKKEELFYGDPTNAGGRKFPRGIYKRVNLGGGRGKLIPLIVFPVQTAQYRPRFDFQRLGRSVVDREFARLFDAALAQALVTAL